MPVEVQNARPRVATPWNTKSEPTTIDAKGACSEPYLLDNKPPLDDLALMNLGYAFHMLVSEIAESTKQQ